MCLIFLQGTGSLGHDKGEEEKVSRATQALASCRPRIHCLTEAVTSHPSLTSHPTSFTSLVLATPLSLPSDPNRVFPQHQPVWNLPGSSFTATDPADPVHVSFSHGSWKGQSSPYRAPMALCTPHHGSWDSHNVIPMFLKESLVSQLDLILYVGRNHTWFCSPFYLVSPAQYLTHIRPSINI